MAQNIYDDSAFFAGYASLPRSIHGLSGAPEWPALRALLPPLRGSRVLDLGCGMGWFCRWAADQRAASVLGIDLSANMLDRAREMAGPASIEYLQADLDEVALEPASRDLVFSSLTFHYLVDLERLWREIAAALPARGAFVFSVEHPMYTAPRSEEWTKDQDGRPAWPVEGYLREGSRSRDWLAPGVIKQHRTMATYMNLLRSCGFELMELVEWGPSDAEIQNRPELAPERERPTFMLVSARKT